MFTTLAALSPLADYVNHGRRNNTHDRRTHDKCTFSLPNPDEEVADHHDQKENIAYGQHRNRFLKCGVPKNNTKCKLPRRPHVYDVVHALCGKINGLKYRLWGNA